MDGWSVDDCLQRQIARKISKLKFKASPVNTGHYMAFKHGISFVTNMAANFRCDCFRIMPEIVSKYLQAVI